MMGQHRAGEVSAEIADIVARMQEKAREREESGDLPELQIPHAPAQVIQLPIWPDAQRAAPNAVLRSALFGVIRRGQRGAVLRKLLVPSWHGITVRYTGFRLDQADLDVWMQVLHLARQRPLGAVCKFTARGVLKSIGRNPSGKHTHEWLKEALARLGSAFVEITIAQRLTYGGNLLELCRDEETERFVLKLNPTLLQLFRDGYTRVEWKQRLSLKRDLAKWLHGYVLSQRATRERPHRIGISRLRELSGSHTQNVRKFRQLLRRDMTVLEKAGAVAYWRITDGDALEFARP
jgi:TrfA protein